MADSSNRDRTPGLLELTKAPWPAPPLNLFMADGTRGVIDLRWDDPSILTLNSRWQLVGVNVYRSFDSEMGPYERMTDLPVGSTFWRDQTDNELVPEEDVTDRFVLFGTAGTGSDSPRYAFKTLHTPIVGEGARNLATQNPHDVRVYVDGVQVPVIRVFGSTGEVEIDASVHVDPNTEQLVQPVLPTQGSRVTCTYRYTRKFLKTDLSQRIFYRVTSVAVPVSGDSFTKFDSNDLVETPLENAAATNTFEIEKLDWIWREAIRRNRWILQQGGERAKVFLRKNTGLQCSCYDFQHKQPFSDCLLCYGTGFYGGYEGPYDILIAPDDAETRIAQKDIGRTTEHSYEVWTGPTPLLSQRDFIMKINGDRYSIGPVRMPSNRGNLLQQHFTIGSFDDKDIRYKVPVGDPVKYGAVQFTTRGPEQEANADITEKDGIGDERQLRGRSLAWKNSNY